MFNLVNPVEPGRNGGSAGWNTGLEGAAGENRKAVQKSGLYTNKFTLEH
jgi:hypothetical protein